MHEFIIFALGVLFGVVATFLLGLLWAASGDPLPKARDDEFAPTLKRTSRRARK